jgi:hypothetical protein
MDRYHCSQSSLETNIMTHKIKRKSELRLSKWISRLSLTHVDLRRKRIPLGSAHDSDGEGSLVRDPQVPDFIERCRGDYIIACIYWDQVLVSEDTDELGTKNVLAYDFGLAVLNSLECPIDV